MVNGAVVVDGRVFFPLEKFQTLYILKMSIISIMLTPSAPREVSRVSEKYPQDELP